MKRDDLDDTTGGGDPAALDYEHLSAWEGGRLVDTYRGLSLDLRRRDYDEQAVRRMIRVEEELCRRGVDTDEIAREVEETHREERS